MIVKNILLIVRFNGGKKDIRNIRKVVISYFVRTKSKRMIDCVHVLSTSSIKGVVYHSEMGKKNIFFFFFRILVIGTAYGWFKKINTRIHIDQILEACAQECQKLERLEIQWDEDTLRWNENSSKFIDHIR